MRRPEQHGRRSLLLAEPLARMPFESCFFYEVVPSRPALLNDRRNLSYISVGREPLLMSPARLFVPRRMREFTSQPEPVNLGLVEPRGYRPPAPAAPTAAPRSCAQRIATGRPCTASSYRQWRRDGALPSSPMALPRWSAELPECVAGAPSFSRWRKGRGRRFRRLRLQRPARAAFRFAADPGLAQPSRHRGRDNRPVPTGPSSPWRFAGRIPHLRPVPD